MNDNASHQPPRDAYEAALAQERLLWSRLLAPDLQPVERVQAYGRWRAAADRTKELALQQVHGAAAGGPPAAQDGSPDPAAAPDAPPPGGGE